MEKPVKPFSPPPHRKPKEIERMVLLKAKRITCEGARLSPQELACVRWYLRESSKQDGYLGPQGKAMLTTLDKLDLPDAFEGAQVSAEILSSSSLLTLAEQGDQHLEYLAERVVRELWVSSVGMVHSKPMRAREVVLKALRELAALLSPVAVDEKHEDTVTRTGDDGLSTSSRTASTNTKG